MSDNIMLIQLIEGVCVFFCSLIWTIVLGIFTNHEDFYNGELCERTSFLAWSKSLFALNVVFVVSSVCIFPCIVACVSSNSDKANSCGSFFGGLYRFSLYVAYIVEIIGMCISLAADSENCGQIRSVGIAYVSTIGLVYTVCCCGSIFMCVAGDGNPANGFKRLK